jgi:hypothetical protein
VLLVHGGDGTLLPVERPAAGVRAASRPNGGPARHARAAFHLLVEAEPAAVAARNVALVTVILAGAVTVPP